MGGGSGCPASGEIIDRESATGNSAPMTVTVARICRYPVKGLSAEDLDRADLRPGEGISQDRRFALAHGTTQYDPEAPRWLPKTSFLMLMRNERLAALDTAFDATTGILTVHRNGKTVARGDVTTAVGRAVIEDFFTAYMARETRGRPRLVEAPRAHPFSDHADPVLSVINLASVRDLERVVGAAVDPVRFRANLYLAGAPSWAEFGWIDREIDLGDARLRFTARIDRCAATNVNPANAERDLNVPKALQRGYGHMDMGVYAAVVKGGTITVGDEFDPPS